jgi:hypothetical protein
LEQFAVVDDRAQDLAHVVRRLGPVGDETVQAQVVGGGFESAGCEGVLGRSVAVVRRQVAEQDPDEVQGVVLVLGEEVGVAFPELLARAPPSSSAVVRSPVTASMTSGPVTNMCEVPSTITVKSVMAGE